MNRNKLVATVAGLVLVIVLALASVALFNGSTHVVTPVATATPALALQAPVTEASPTPQTIEALAVSTPVLPTDTPAPPAPPPSDTPSPVPPTASATPVPPTATPQPVVQAPKSSNPAAPKPPAPTKQPTKDPNILPNGVRYGDHYPKLPDRIVRIASPDIKLDAKVYEVYAVKGEWEVADYAAGHNYNSANPGEGGNIVLSGHNNWRGEVFRYLEFLKVGNEIDVWTLDGKEHKYVVDTMQKLKEAGATMAERLAHGHVMDPTPYEQLTLITCWPYTTYTHRLIITAKPMQ